MISPLSPARRAKTPYPPTCLSGVSAVRKKNISQEGVNANVTNLAVVTVLV